MGYHGPMAESKDYLNSQFLIAMPAMGDPNFSQSVTLICEHNEDGALGLVVNRPLQLTLGDMLAHMKIQPTNLEVGEQPVLMGGPVQTERGFVLHGPPGDWDATMEVDEDLYITSSRDILEAMAEGRGPEHAMVALGYAGWGAGQLEAELKENAWLNTPADQSILFETPINERWSKAAHLIGVDLNTLSGDAGHA